MDEIDAAFNKIKVKRAENNALDHFRGVFIDEQKKRGFLDVIDTGERIRDIINGWKKPEEYTKEEYEKYGDERNKVPFYRTETDICHVVRKTVINNLRSPDHVYYFICFRNSKHKWNKSWWRHVTIPSYRNQFGMMINWPIANRLYELKEMIGLNMISLVICVTDEDYSNHAFWYASAPKVIDFISKHQPNIPDKKYPYQYAGRPVRTDWYSLVFGIPQYRYFDTEDIFKYEAPIYQ